MIDLGTLSLGIKVDNQDANQQLQTTSDKASKLNKAGDIAKGTFKAVGKTMAVSAAAIAATGASVFKLAEGTSEAQDRIDKMSQSIGMSAESFQEWDYVMAQNGASIDNMKTGMKTLMSGSKSTQEAFSALGLTITDSMSNEEVFEQTVKALQGMDDETKKAQLATDLFGKSGLDLMPMLNQTAEGTEELKKRAKDLGLVMSNESVTAGVQFGDTLSDLKKTAIGFGNSIASNFTPSLNEGMEALIGMMSGAEGSEEAFQQALDSFINQVVTQLPIFIEKGMAILQSLLIGIVSAIPTLIQGVITIIPTITNALVELLPLIIQAGIDMILALIQGIVEIIPQLIPTIVEVIITIVNTLLDNIPLLIDAGIQILFALMDGLIEALPTLIDEIPTIIDKLIIAITDNLPKLVEAGTKLTIQLALGLIKAIPQLLAKIPQIITSLVKGIANYYKNIFNVGKELLTKMWEGIKSMGGWLGDKIKGFFTPIFEGIKTIAEAPLKGIQGLLNGLISGLNVLIKGANKISFDVPDWVPVMGGKKFGFNIPEIPKVQYFAEGGIMTKPTTFGFMNNRRLVGGEAGAEAILPLNKLPELIQKLGLMPNQGAIHTQINIDGREFAVATSPYISQELAFAR